MVRIPGPRPWSTETPVSAGYLRLRGTTWWFRRRVPNTLAKRLGKTEVRWIVPLVVTIKVGVDPGGRREVLSMVVGSSKAEPFWLDFLSTLKRVAWRA